MPCVQVKCIEKGPKEYIHYFSDLKFEQGDRVLPDSMLFMSLVRFKHNEVQATDELEHVVTRTRSFLSNYDAGKPCNILHFWNHPNCKKEVIANENPPLENDESDVILSKNKDAESINQC